MYITTLQATLAAETINRAMETLQAWMSSNRLHLNPAMTQLIWFGKHQQLTKTGLDSLVLKYPNRHGNVGS